MTRASGCKLSIFWRLPGAREHFPQEEFDRAFRQIFRGEDFDNSSGSESALRARLVEALDDYDLLSKSADVYISRGKFEKATPLLEHASRIRPNEYTPVEALTEIYRRTGRDGKAKSTKWLWVSAHPVSVEAYTTQIEKAKPERALALVAEALESYPNSAVLHYDRAALLHSAHDVQGSELEFARAAKLAPDSAVITSMTPSMRRGESRSSQGSCHRKPWKKGHLWKARMTFCSTSCVRR
ncbi:MAG: hypothetical protein DMG52_22760 [Acidobacteria bacterium]|nr:MAG: hypothetical protein DMG52_22760 [Acidobacteriota bacterium]